MKIKKIATIWYYTPIKRVLQPPKSIFGNVTKKEKIVLIFDIILHKIARETGQSFLF